MGALTRLAGLYGLLALVTTANAEILVFTDRASFIAAAPDVYVDTFEDLSPNTFIPGFPPYFRQLGPYTYSAATTSGTFTGGVPGNTFLSGVAIQFVGSSAPYAIGGDFGWGAITTTSARFDLRDSLGTEFQVSCEQLSSLCNYGYGFIGFVSTGEAIQFLGLYSVGTSATLDNLAVAVPEAPTLLLMLGGVALMSGVTRRMPRPIRDA